MYNMYNTHLDICFRPVCQDRFNMSSVFDRNEHSSGFLVKEAVKTKRSLKLCNQS